MNSLRNMSKQLLRTLLKILFSKSPSLIVFSGPLRACRIPKQRGLDQLSMLAGRYEPDFSRWFTHYSADANVIYDIGCNYGYFTLLASRNPSAKVYAFEPVPLLQDEFRALAQWNGLESRTFLVPKAVSDTQGLVSIVTPGSDETGLMESALRGQHYDKDNILEVDSLSIDHWMSSEQSPAPDLIKIDVEGAEGLVLKGAAETIRQYKPTILVEVHGAQPAADIWAFSQRTGYNVAIIKGRQIVHIPSMEAWTSGFNVSKWTITHALLTPATH